MSGERERAEQALRREDLKDFSTAKALARDVVALHEGLKLAYPYVMDALKDARGLPAVQRVIEGDLAVIVPLLGGNTHPDGSAKEPVDPIDGRHQDPDSEVGVVVRGNQTEEHG